MLGQNLFAGTALVRDLREGRIEKNDLAERLASDSRLGLDAATIDAIITQGEALTGNAAAQVDAFAERARAWAGTIPGAGDYTPGAIL